MAIGYFTVDLSVSRGDEYIVLDEDNDVVDLFASRSGAEAHCREEAKEHNEVHRVYKLVGVAKPRRKVVDVDYEEID